MDKVYVVSYRYYDDALCDDYAGIYQLYSKKEDAESAISDIESLWPFMMDQLFNCSKDRPFDKSLIDISVAIDGTIVCVEAAKDNEAWDFEFQIEEKEIIK